MAMVKDHDFVPKCMKLSVFFMTFLYWFLGILAAGAGLFMHSYQMLPVQELITVQFSPPFMLIIMGIVLFITAIFGFVGALRENVCFLRWYLVILLFLLMVNLAMGTVACVVLFSSPVVHAQAEEMLQIALMRFQDDNSSADYINKIQTMLQCCGIGPRGYKDWMRNPYFACTEDNISSEKCSVPASCCRFESLERIDLTCGFGVTDEAFISESRINTEGCIPRAEEMIENVATLLAFSAFGIATTLLCGIIIASNMLQTLEFKVNEYWQQFSFQNKEIPSSPPIDIFHIPVLATKHEDCQGLKLKSVFQ